jgi:hypothetical protein
MAECSAKQVQVVAQARLPVYNTSPVQSSGVAGATIPMVTASLRYRW